MTSYLIFGLPVLFVAVILHEIAHGLAAERLGDDTARRLGRITLNPLRHIDPVMTLLIPGILIVAGSPFIVGGAKPVPVDPRRFKNPRRGMALVALAGPVTNLILAGMALVGFYLAKWKLESFLVWGFPILALVIPFFVYGVLINVVLAVFNLFPIPPLDGGRIAVGLLPFELARKYARLERYGLLIVVLLLSTGALDMVLTPVINGVVRVLDL